MLTAAQKKQITEALSALEDLAAALRDVVEDRQAYESDRTDKWRESEKGAEFADELPSLEAAADEIDSAISNLGNLTLE